MSPSDWLSSIGTGRCDFPDPVKNVLAFLGIFRGAHDAGFLGIKEEMKLAAARPFACCVANPTAKRILPHTLDRSV